MSQRRVAGCIVKMWHDDKEVLDAIAEELRKDGIEDVAVLEDGRQNQSEWMLRHIRYGNIDLQGWMRQFASDLENYRIDELHNMGDNLRVDYELVY